MRILVTVLVAAVCAGLLGCGDRGGSTRAVRLLDDPGIARTDPLLAWGEVVTIDDVPRPVISASKPITPPSEETWTAGHQVSAVIPEELRAVPWLVFATVVVRGGTPTVMRSLPVIGAQAGRRFSYGVVDERVGPDGKVGIMLWPAPDLKSRDVETGEVAIPAHAVLEVAAALEPITWKITVIPIDMTVTAIADGRETVLHTIRIDPRMPEDQHWHELSIPLDAVAGRRARLRFSSRPLVGPTATLALPVWADPTIVVGAAAR